MIKRTSTRRRRAHGAAYVEYIVLAAVMSSAALATTFTILPRITNSYHTTDIALTSTEPQTAGATLPDGDGGGSLPVLDPSDPPLPDTPPPPVDPTPTDPTPADPTPTDPTPPDPTPPDPPAIEPPTPQPAPPPPPPPPPPPHEPEPAPQPEAPQFGPFDFGDRVFEWNNTMWRVTSPYVDIDGVADIPVPYTVTGDGRPMAQANVPGGPSAQSVLYHGTDLQIDVPSPGGSHTGTLHIDKRKGSFRVRTKPIPDQEVRGSQLWLWVPVHWEGRTVSISGQGNPGAQPNGGNFRATNTLPDGRITHGTASNGFNLVVNAPPKGEKHRVIITIDGNTSSFDVIHK